MRFVVLLAVLAAACQPDPGGFAPLPERSEPARPPERIDPVILDRHVQIPSPQVDMLFVVDNSCSMDAEQTALAQNFPRFVNYFATSGTDFHIGVVSTDADASDAGLLRQAQGHRYIDRDTPNPSAVFSTMAQMGIGGSAAESGRLAAYTALELLDDHPRNVGFEREDATLHMMVISDEDDATSPVDLTIPEWQNWMSNRKARPEDVVFHALVWPTGQNCPTGFATGALYEQYASFTGGVVGNICDPDWTAFIDELGLATSGLRREFFLSQLPQVDTLDVSVEHHLDDGGEVTLRFDVCMAGEPDCDVEYVPGRNSIVFTDWLPEPLDVVLIRYQLRTTAYDPGF